jgi:hypothetical protein
VKSQIQSAQFFLILVLVMSALCASHGACAQAPGATSPSAQVPATAAGQPQGLFISILDGEGALNDIRTRTAREPIVEVDDENHKPVAGALVLFSIDNGGGSPFATFSGANSLSVTTDSAGRAVGRGFEITERKGPYKINVHASKGQLEAESVISEANITALVSANGETPAAVAAAHHIHWGWIIGGIAVAGGAAAGIVIATQSSSSPTTVTPGGGTVGAPAAVSGIRIPLHGHGH